MSARLRTLTVVAVILAGMAIPSNAAPQPTNTLEAMVSQTLVQLQPIAQQRGVTFIVEAPGATSISGAEMVLAQDRIVNLLANAIAMAPTDTTVNVSVTPDDLRVWFTNQGETYTVERNVEDSTGNAFIVRSVAGQGTELSFSFDRTVVSAP